MDDRRAELIRKATLAARNSFDAYVEEELRRILAVFEDAATNITQRIGTFSAEGAIPPTRLKKLYTAIEEEIRILRKELRHVMKSGVGRSFDQGLEGAIRSMLPLKDSYPKYKIQIGTSFLDQDGIIHKWNAMSEKFGDSMWARIHGNALDFLLRYSPDGMTLSQRIWDITREAERKIKFILTRNVLQGVAPADFSPEIMQFLADPGKGITGNLSIGAMQYKPGRGVYKSSFQNAMRVARTEYARAFHEGTLRYGQQKKWITGYISRVGSGNPAPYDASMDGHYFPKESPPAIPYHPNCMCYAEIVTDQTYTDEIPRGITQEQWKANQAA